MWCYNLSEPPRQSADPSVSKFDCKCFRATALLVTSSNNIFKTLGIQRLAMLLYDSACILTNRICGATFYQSLRALTPVSQSLTVSVSEPEHFWGSSNFQHWYLQNAWDSETGGDHKQFSVHFDHRICGATIYQSLRALTPISQSLTVSVSEPQHF